MRITTAEASELDRVPEATSDVQPRIVQASWVPNR